MVALAGARRYRVDGGRLQLLGADGVVLASLVAQSQSLAGTSVEGDRLQQRPAGGRQSPSPATEPTLAFAATAATADRPGCNNVTGAVTVQGEP